jgi:hypothetical protein
LRGRGFAFHTFTGFGKRFIQPFHAPGEPHSGHRQILWSDAVYVKDFMRLDRLTDEKLLKLVTILGATVGSFDLAGLVLREYDRRRGTAYAQAYIESMLQQFAAARAKAS